MVDESLGSTSVLPSAAPAGPPLLARPVSESTGCSLDAADPVAGFRRPTRRPTSAGVARTRQGSTLATSRVHQKLQEALQSAETTGRAETRAATGCTDLIQAQSLQSSFRARGIASAAAAEKELADRSISRYRNDAAIASFATDASPSCSFCYSTNFMPGVHFYTFLASKDASGAAATVASQGVSSSGPPVSSSSAITLADSNGQPAAAGHAESSTSAAKKSTGLRMWIPDTIVYGETGRAIWLYTDEHGFVQRSADVSDKLVTERLVPTNGCDPHPVVVCKEPTTILSKKQSATNTSALAYQGNLLRLLSAGELKTVLSNVSSARSSKSFALQKFIRCNGSKAFIVRAVYDVGKPAYAWMINNTRPMVTPTPTVSQVLLSLGQDAPLVAATGTAAAAAATTTSSRSGSVIGGLSSSTEATVGEASTLAASPPPPLQSSVAVPLVNRVCTSVQVDKACTFIKLSERGCATVAELNQRLVKYIEQRLHLQLQTLVADYVKDTDGKWWLLQVKHFRVRHARASKPYYSLPRRLRMQYLAYRDSSLMEETTESDEEDELERHAAHLAALQAQRQVLKLLQCKCCLAAYPKAELSFKMTLKMISEMLVRVRSRQAPDKSCTFLATALARESPDASLAYESWSVCSYCYAIYERDQQLQKVEAKFAEILGMPDARTALAGLGKLDERSKVIDPNATSTVLPVQLTLCRLMLVINGIYDIPPELYDAERDPVEILTGTSDSSGRPRPLQTVTSRLYLRISALGYTECIPVDPADIMFTQEQAPRGARQRTSSVSSTVDGKANGDDDDDEDDDDDGSDNDDNERREHTRSPRSPRSRLPSRTRVPSAAAPRGKRNYWLPINLIRTVTFFAPRTPLQAKLKETSGLTPFLNEDNSISIQFIRATEPPLNDLTTTTTSSTSTFSTTGHVERGRTRRAALQPNRTKTEGVATPPQHRHKEQHHSVLLGATKIRMAQFRSAYVTKLDFYACMALRGEMFNVKGNIGLERVRYVDTKLLTAQYRLRAYNGVYIPDASYVPSDPLTSEWMDCLRATINPHSPNGRSDKHAPESMGHTRGASALNPSQRSSESMRRSISTTSLGAGGEEMDEELEQMIDLACDGDPPLASIPSAGRARPKTLVPPLPLGNTGPKDTTQVEATTPSSVIQPWSTIESLLPTNKTPSRFDSHMAMLLHKPVLSPRGNLTACPPRGSDVDANTGSLNAAAPSSGSNRSLWSLTIQLNNAHHLQTRERPYCRWECYYEMLGQRRSAVERPPKNAEPSSSSLASSESAEVASPTDITFSCTHRFFLSATPSMLRDHFRAHKTVTLNLRNDVYSSTRSRSMGEFFCQLDVSGLVSATSFDTTLDIHAGAFTPELTPREASVMAHSPPYLSVSLQLSQLASDPNEVISNGSFVVVGATNEDIHVLKKII